MTRKVTEKQRQRAPSQRSLQTRDRILDAAELLFAQRGFDGASIRDIAAQAGVQGALVNHHGGSKDALFETVVARRAADLARRRTEALARATAQGNKDLNAILSAFLNPFLDLVDSGDPGWRAYARLIAHVSADDRWRGLAADWFDPTAQVFLDEIETVLPDTPRGHIGAAFVFMVSAMLSLTASQWRFSALVAGSDPPDLRSTLHDYCTAGFQALGQT